MILTLIFKKSIYSQSLPEKKQGQYWITCKNSENNVSKLLSVEAAGESWLLKSNREAYLCGKNDCPIGECQLETMNFYKIKVPMVNEYAFLYCEPSTEDRKKFFKLILPSDGCLKIGRSESCDIIYSNAFVSSVNAEINIRSGKLSVVDRSSSNGTFVNGIKVNESKLDPGDVIFIMGFKIIAGKGYISINNPDGKVRINNNSLLAYKSQPIEAYTPSFMVDNKTNTVFYRSPRLKRDLETFEISVDPPPSCSVNQQMPMILTLGPSVTMGLASVTMAITSLINVINGKSSILNSLPMLVMSVAMLCGTLLWPTLIKNYEKKKNDEKENKRQEKYKAYLNSIKSELNNECTYQREILNENLVPLDVCLSRIKLVQRNLWERTSRHNDFLTLRLGKGSLPLDCNIKCQKRKFSLDEDDLLELQYQLSERKQMITDAPLALPLRETIVTGIIGKKNDATAFAKSLLFQLVSLHSYDEVNIVMICNEMDRTWDFVKWLPHVWDEEHNMRFIATNPVELKELSTYMERVISERENARGYNEASYSNYFVVFAMDQELSDHAEFLKLIYRQKNHIGFSVLSVSNEINNLPKECSRIIELSPQRSRIFDRDDISGKFTEFVPELFTDGKEEAYALTLANITLGSNSDVYKMPTTLTFTEVYDVGKIEHINILSRWKENDPTTSLDAVIGVDQLGEKFSLNIHEKAHGPHGLIAGTTGSGKSEFIMTYILAMAVNYHPSEVAFILIDYKGGGMAKAFEKLPHTAGIITNLDGSEVNRSLVSIQSELKRRQALFTQTGKSIGMSNIDIYKYQRLYRDGTVSEPLPHLIIISDEFAELKAQQPDFMAELVSTARIGRSLGVHLVLATQKPTGVVDDQILSNTRFRICLKVQDRQDSMEMLKRPDAADITVTGRFYLQVGNNEIFKLGQSAWSGAHYKASDRVEPQVDNSISIFSNTGKILKKIRPSGKKDSNAVSQLDAITQYISDLAKMEGFSQRMLWCPSIPAMIKVDDLVKKYSFKQPIFIEPVVGEYDIPSGQKQAVLTLPFSRSGNVAVYGASGGGKTTFVTTAIYSLITQYTPDQVNVYALDFSAQTLSVFSKAPHIGDIIFPDDREKVMNLFKMLNTELKRRKNILKDHGGDFAEYQKEANEKMPAIVVIIHNYTGLAESYEVEEQIAFLTREGAKRGIYFVATAQSAEAIRHRVLQNFGQLLVLKMNDSMDYSSILGNVGGMFPAGHLGRGIFKDKNVYEFQTAHCVEQDESRFIRELCASLAAEWSGEFAQQIPILPERVDSDFLATALGRSPENSVPVGVDKDKLSIINYPLFDTSTTWVLSQSGKNGLFLQGLAEIVYEKSDTQLYVMSPNDDFDFDDPSICSYAFDADSVNSMADEIFKEMLRRYKAFKQEPNSRFERMLCVISSLSMVEETLNEINNHNFFDVLKNVKKEYNIFFVISDSSSYLNSVANKPWVTSQFNFKDAIWLGNGLKDDPRLSVNKDSKHFRESIDKHCGFVIINEKARLTKLLISRNWEPEEE